MMLWMMIRIPLLQERFGGLDRDLGVNELSPAVPEVSIRIGTWHFLRPRLSPQKKG